MDLTFLSSGEPLTKTIEKNPDGTITKSPYPHVSDFTSHSENAPNLDAFEALLKRHAAKHHCLLKGNINKPLVNASRAGSTDSNANTFWVCLDVDGANVDTIDQFLELVGLGDLECVVQYSASHKIDTGLRAHVFAMLAKPTSPSTLKMWLKHLNLSTELVRDIRLSKAGVALRWPLDITTCQNDKLLYIAPPILKGKLKDPVRERVYKREGKLKSIKLPDLDFSGIDARAHKTLNSLRKAANLRAYNRQPVVHNGLEIMPQPGKATITGMKEARGFTYFNLNGGDSWGYYHSDDDFEVIRNFKGEPNYLTKELLPSYYADCRAKSRPDTETPDEAEAKGGRTKFYLAFLDTKSDQYYRGVWDVPNNALQLNPTSSFKKLNDFLVDVGEIPLENVPEWNIEFDPARPLVDIDKRWINRYQPTKYATLKPDPNAKCPAPFMKLFEHVLNYDAAAVEHFLNWLAVIWQHKTMTQTAWLLQGTFGTGKGMFYEQIFVPLFGNAQCRILPLLKLAKDFNGWIDETQIVFFDESRIENTEKYRVAIETLKSITTMSEVECERKGANSYKAKNYSNFVIASNYTDSVHVPVGDRRFNVGAYQYTPLKDVCDPEELIKQLQAQLDQFAVYLASRTADKAKARTPLMNEAREEAIETSMTAQEEIVQAIKEGNLGKVLEWLPSDDAPMLDAGHSLLLGAFRATIDEAMRSVVEARPHKIPRDTLRNLMEFACGNMPMSPSKFSRLLAHRGLKIEVIEYKGKSIRGLMTHWKYQKDLAKQWLAPAPVTPVPSKVTPIRKTK